MPDGNGKPVPDGNGKPVPEGRGRLNEGRPVGYGPCAGAAKTATGARMATKRVKVLESCMLTDFW